MARVDRDEAPREPVTFLEKRKSRKCSIGKKRKRAYFAGADESARWEWKRYWDLLLLAHEL